MNRRSVYAIGLAWGLAAGLYAAWGRELVLQSHAGTAPAWFQAVVDAVYPRFAVEKHRFEPAFFLRHADQVVLRLGLVVAAAVAAAYALRHVAAVRTRFRQLQHTRVPALHLKLYVGVTYVSVLYFTHDWYGLFGQLHAARAFYQPLTWLRWLPFPALPVAAALCGLLWAGCAAVLLQWRGVPCAVLVAGVFTVLQGWLYGFEKLDHAYAPLTYVLWLMPVLLQQTRRHMPQWALPLMRLVVGMVYLQAGLEKWLVGGAAWLAPGTFRNYLYLHPTPPGLWVAGHDWLCTALPLLASVVQVGFVGMVWAPRWRWVLLPAGVAFHAGTYLLMGIGGYVHTWLWLYVLFLG